MMNIRDFIFINKAKTVNKIRILDILGFESNTFITQSPESYRKVSDKTNEEFDNEEFDNEDFDNEELLGSINKAKWNIYSIALQDLVFFSFSYLNVFFSYQEVNNAKKIYENILDDETLNGMPVDIIEKGNIINFKGKTKLTLK